MEAEGWHMVRIPSLLIFLLTTRIPSCTPHTFNRTRPFTEFWEDSTEHLRRVWHADRGRLLLWTPGPVPLGLAYVLLVETNPFSELVVFMDYALRKSLGTFSILLPVKFRWIPFSSFRGEVENVWANKRPGRPSFFLIGPKVENVVEDVGILHPVNFRWIPFSGLRGEVENVSVNQRSGRKSCWRASKFSVFKIDWNCKSVGLLHHPFWLCLVFRHLWGINFQPFINYFVWLRITDEGSVPEMRIWSIMLIRSDLKWCIHLSRSLFLYSNRPENTNFAEDVEILLPVKFGWIP